MNLRTAGVLAAVLALASPTASAQEAPPAPAPDAAEAEVFGPAPPPQEMGPFEEGAEEAAPADAEPAPAADALPADPVYERLLGGEPEARPDAAVAPPALRAPQMPVWLWGILALMVVALIASRRSLLPKRGKDEGIDVRSRATLGKDGNLAVVEVGDGVGGRRRLLVGFGTGAPRLVADLTPLAEFAPPASGDLDGGAPVGATLDRVVDDAGTAPVRERPTLVRAVEEPATGAMDPNDRWEEALRQAEGKAERAARRRPPRPLERRGDLIAEVLAERTRRSVEVGDALDVDAEDAGDPTTGNYTFRGTRG